MILFHGSNTIIETIDLEKCRPYKDFGKGFYTTDIEHQAQRMSERTANTFGGSPVITKYEFNLQNAIDSGLKIKIFDSPDEDWAEFVMANRDFNISQPCHDYDIVIGPVADDKIARLLRLYTEDFISREELLRKLTFAEVTSQYFFHTESSLKMIKKL